MALKQYVPLHENQQQQAGKNTVLISAPNPFDRAPKLLPIHLYPVPTLFPFLRQPGPLSKQPLPRH